MDKPRFQIDDRSIAAEPVARHNAGEDGIVIEVITPRSGGARKPARTALVTARQVPIRYIHLTSDEFEIVPKEGTEPPPR